MVYIGLGTARSIAHILTRMLNAYSGRPLAHKAEMQAFVTNLDRVIKEADSKATDNCFYIFDAEEYNEKVKKGVILTTPQQYREQATRALHKLGAPGYE